MNNKAKNEGLRCIKEIVAEFDSEVDWEVFDIRGENSFPDLSFDIFISSGGPGSPLEEGEWKQRYFDLVDNVWKHNLKKENDKKYFFFICYSFQVACEHFKLCTINRRKSTSFGVFPIHKTKVGKKDPILSHLRNPYYAVDSRDWQVVQPKHEVFEEHGAKILSIETFRTHAEYERAIMAVSFSDEFFGTQFHPEADPEGMKAYFSRGEMKEKIISNYDEQKYIDMIEHIDDPDKIRKTHETILPVFIATAIEKISSLILV